MLGLELTADPLKHCVVFLMAWVHNHAEEIFISVRVTSVLRRTCPLAII